MADRPAQQPHADERPNSDGQPNSGQQPNPAAAVKAPDEWVTADEPPTAAQRSYLSTLAREAGEQVPDGLTKAEASKMIDELQERTGRGR